MNKKKIACSLAIVGGGISGLYAAEYIARNKLERSVCVFEGDPTLGGRVKDKRFIEAPDVVAGMGAWRIHLQHANMMNLTKRFDIPVEDWTFNPSDKMEARGVFTNDTLELKKKAYPTLQYGKFANVSKAEQLWDMIMDPNNLIHANDYTDFGSYIKGVLGPEAWEYLDAAIAYKNDLAELDVATYVEFNQLEAGDNITVQRPNGGMSAYIEKLRDSAIANSVRIYTNQMVAFIGLYDDKNPDFLYHLESDDYLIDSQKLILAVPPVQLARISGSVIETIAQQNQFQSIQPQPAMKGAAVYAQPWWRMLPNESGRLQDMQRYLTTSACLQMVVPYKGSGPDGTAVLHTIFASGPCAEHWRVILNQEKSRLDKAVQQQLSYLFPGVNVPPAIDTEYQYWPDGAWHFQSPDWGFSLEDIEKFAMSPIKNGVQNGTLFLVGEAYNRRRTWCEGAIRSVNNILNYAWGVSNPDGDVFGSSSSVSSLLKTAKKGAGRKPSAKGVRVTGPRKVMRN